MEKVLQNGGRAIKIVVMPGTHGITSADSTGVETTAVWIFRAEPLKLDRTTPENLSPEAG